MNRLTKARYGNMLYHENDTLIGKSLELYGEWSQAELDFLNTYIPINGICVDIGANIGTHTLFFSEKVGPCGCVVAFEPQQTIFQLLCANAALNMRYNIQAHNVAIYESSCIMNFTKFDYSKPQNFGIAHKLSAEQPHENMCQVRADPLDLYRFPKLDLIKIDVEGLEPEIILGAKKTILKHQPFIYAEYHPQSHSMDLVEIIKELEYDVFLHQTSSFNPNNFKNQSYDIHNNYIEMNIFCIPRTKQITTSTSLNNETQHLIKF